mgnify:CR=1 FL=1|tara:strand:- start:2253 stop:3083 length:831 start_codon:yes stop_codon:yes gene_type:complete
MKKLKLCIVGHGFVGKAVDYGFNDHSVNKTIIDPNYNTTLENTDLDADVTFVCVPTPMGKDGKIDASIVIKTVMKLKQMMCGIIVIKSTVVPSVVKKLVKDSFVGDRIIYNPEFLTEKNANEDFINPRMHVFGGAKRATKSLERIYNDYSLCRPCQVYHMSAEDASFVKYGINCFLASKVLWFNQFYDVVQNKGGNFGRIVNAIGEDPRIGQSHTRVPGFDGKRGYGGACFPKDTSAFANFAETFSVLDHVIEKNNEYRVDYEKDDREKEQNVSYE